MRALLGHHLRIYQREHLWLPAGLWALFAMLVAVMRGSGGRDYQSATAFLCYVLPLMAGVLASSAVVDDAALELQLAAPRAPWRMLLERLALLLGLVALAAAAFQLYLVPMGTDLSPLGNLAVRQLAWLIPTLTLMGLASAAALGFVQGTNGALLAGGMWILQLIMRGWFMLSRWARYVFLFLGERQPDSPALTANRLCLVGMAAVLVVAASLMLKNEERYL